MIAAFVKSSLDSMVKLDPAIGERVRASLEPEVLRLIEESSRISWLPVQADVDLTECFFEVAGSERACRAFHDALYQSLHSPLLRPLVDGAFAIFRGDVHLATRWIARGWSLIYRDCGEIKIIRLGDSAARIEIHGLPESIARSSNYVKGIGAAMMALFELRDIKGELALEVSNPATRSVAFEFRW